MAISMLDRLTCSYPDDRVQCCTQYCTYWTADQTASNAQLMNQTLCEGCETECQFWIPQAYLSWFNPRFLYAVYRGGLWLWPWNGNTWVELHSSLGNENDCLLAVLVCRCSSSELCICKAISLMHHIVYNIGYKANSARDRLIQRKED